MNKIVLKGRLTADPELKTTQTGVETCNFTVAVDRYAGKDKEKMVNFIPCRAWRATAAFVSKYFAKGKEILVDGTLNVDKYEKDGENRTYTYVNVESVEFCGSKSDSSTAPTNAPATTAAAPDVAFSEVDDDNDLPF